ncbi:aminotransferase class I/II-fold pyridoxal phosphate-dependent enzyme [Candidatus Accumulibacter sp. ACC007]|uniref:aminotransferase class I/II-fold pyridoxal phosphate-dependent enzyme n=1 Tax=Candidatus Accumulibacter sp. ACC007 TaxID=2823333 RepID=UPI0025C34D74|nr:aminotransferase class I/II-fold pyridoxal phosphate-dependent enzyme [Candidatus Accumulibacter sp. ACC007]
MAVNKHLVLDASVILDLWLRPERATATEGLFNCAEQGRTSLWVSAASLPTLEFVAVRRLKEQGVEPALARSLVTRLMADLLKRVTILSNSGYEQAELYASSRDFEDAQIAASARALSAGQVCIVSSDVAFDTLGEFACRQPEQALEWLLEDDSAHPEALSFIDLAAQQVALRPQIERNMDAVLRHGQFIMGPEVNALEEKLAEYTGAKHCITVASGTEALLISLMALGIGVGDEVITTPFTFVATAEVIVLLGAKPVFVDIEPDTCNLDANRIEAAITPNTKAIMPVSLYGQPADMDEITAIAAKYKLPVIEDAAQSFGAVYKGKRSCNLSTIGCTSFFPSKPLGCYGDGGAIFTSDDRIAQASREIRVHGQSKRYWHTRIGVGGRMDTLQCAVVLAKLERFNEEVEQRIEIGTRYQRLLSGTPAVQGAIVRPDRSCVWAQFTIQVPHREAFLDKLTAAGISTAVHYPVPLHQQPAYHASCRVAGSLDCSDLIASKVVSLPMHPYLDQRTQERIVEAVLKAVA